MCHCSPLTPGTNINEALQRAVHMLIKAANQGLIDQRSVSMIILVSDGDPTVGEGILSIELNSALHNSTQLSGKLNLVGNT